MFPYKMRTLSFETSWSWQADKSEMCSDFDGVLVFHTEGKTVGIQDLQGFCRLWACAVGSDWGQSSQKRVSEMMLRF